MSSNRPAQLVAALLIMVFFAIAGCSGEQDAHPSPGTIIDFTNITPTSLTVNWTKATDDNTVQQYLEYKVVYHIYDVIGTASSALQYGREVPLIIENSDGEEEEITWVQDNTSIDVKDLDDGKEYYFTVVVRDRYWNATAYTPDTCKTIDITAPEPGNDSVLEISDEIKNNETNEVALTLSWTKASDNNTSGPTVLEYRVVYSTSNNIGNINSAIDNDMTPEDKQIWTTDIATSADIADGYISGLPYGTCYYFNVLVRDEAGNTATYTTISQKPEAGDDGILSISDENEESIILNWTKATDSKNDASELEYRVVYSTSDNIRNLEEGGQYNAEDNDESPYDWGDSWVEKDIDLKEVTGLTAGTNYYFNVIVRDIAGIKTIYETITNAPEPGGGLSISDAQPASLTLSWNMATDNGSDDEDTSLQYKVVQSTSDNISTVAEIESNGTIIRDGGYVDSFDVSGLDSNTDYYFNVLVRDAFGHMAAYNSKGSAASTRAATSLTRVFSMVLGSASSSAGTSSAKSDVGLPPDTEVTESLEEDAPLAVDNNTGDLVVWLDGSDVNGDNTLFQGRPEIWKDKSGHGNNAIQHIPEKRPLAEKSAVLNNKSVVRFDQERGDSMLVDLCDFSDAYGNLIAFRDCTIFIVANDVLSEGYFFGDIDVNGHIEPYLFLDVNENKNLLSGIFDGTDLNGFILGAAGDTFFNGDIAEFIVFDRTLSAAKQEKIKSYLSSKWGIPQ